MGVKVSLSNRWLRVALESVLVVLAAFCFLRYIGWAFSYSAALGLPSRIRETQLANHRAWLFLCVFLALEVLSGVLVAFSWEPPDLGSAWLRFAARYGLGLALSLVATGIVVGLRLAFVR
jgi:hypothetical protein